MPIYYYVRHIALYYIILYSTAYGLCCIARSCVPLLACSCRASGAPGGRGVLLRSKGRPSEVVSPRGASLSLTEETPSVGVSVLPSRDCQYLSDKERAPTLSPPPHLSPPLLSLSLPWPRHRYSARQHCEVCFASGRLPPVFLPHVISTSDSLIFSFMLAAGRPFQIIYGRLFIL